MRTSRVSQDTARVLKSAVTAKQKQHQHQHQQRQSSSVSPPPPTRRITRSSIAKFAYVDGSDTANVEPVADAADIEDAIPDLTASSWSRSTRKRKRTQAVATSVSSHSSVDVETTITSGSEVLVSGGGRRSRKIKKEEAEVVAEVAVEAEVKPAARKAPSTASKPLKRAQRRPARKTVDPSTGTADVALPSDWEEIYATVSKMRSAGGAAANAPVDTMGCERLALASASPRDQRFQTLIALMLSSQTKDTTNAVAMRRLQTELPPADPSSSSSSSSGPGLNLENILAVPPEKLNELIWAVGFHNNKTRYIKQTAEILRDEFAGDVPQTIEGLVSLPGVGPKMAYLCLSAAWGRTEGIGVDVHVHRITNLWGWHGTQTRTPEETRARLESWLPRDRWRDINWLLVGLGQTVCLPVGRKCGECELGLNGLCRAAERKKVVEGRKRREVKVREEVVKLESTEGGGGDGMVKVEKVVKEEVQEQVVRDMVVNEEVDAKDST